MTPDRKRARRDAMTAIRLLLNHKRTDLQVELARNRATFLELATRQATLKKEIATLSRLLAEVKE